jgi:hypothetical protein
LFWLLAADVLVRTRLYAQQLADGREGMHRNRICGAFLDRSPQEIGVLEPRRGIASADALAAVVEDHNVYAAIVGLDGPDQLRAA